MARMRAAQVRAAKGPFEIVERDVPEPGPGQVRIRVQASGICHSDPLTKEGLWPGIRYPRVPGHEVAGVVDAVGEGVADLRTGARVAPQIPGITYDGGYADYVVAPAAALARIPDGLAATDAAPLMCAGVTTFNALRHADVRPGDLVAVLGIGGLGHLGVQYAARMGHETVAIARGKDKEPLARQLGAHHYIDSEAEDPARRLAALGGARVILATATSGKAMAAALGGLAIDGTLLVVGAAPDPLEVPAATLIGGRRKVAGWPSGTSSDSEETLAFSARQGVRPMNELFPLEHVAEGYERMMSGQARFRVVLETGS
jgi:D-arabinose 1-dehydrogenase-like Zn-dependent alcohol dehydrogenase